MENEIRLAQRLASFSSSVVRPAVNILFLIIKEITMWKMPHEPPPKGKCDRIYWPRMRHCRISVIFGGRHLHVLAFSPPSRHSSAIAISSDNSSRIVVVAQKAVSFEHASDPVSDRFGREEDFLEMKRTLSSAFEWESSGSRELVLVWVTFEFNYLSFSLIF